MNIAPPQNLFASLNPDHRLDSRLDSRPVKARASEANTLEARFARRIASRLEQSAADVPHDVSERLRFARDLALQKARLARVAEAAASASVYGAGSEGTAMLSLGGMPGRKSGRNNPWWLRIAAIVPLLTLVGGLVLIQRQHNTAQIKAAADIDAALLADDLPPAAYADPAFAEFLRAPRD